MKKTYIRSIRMTEETREFIETFTGTGFNEKFENAVHYFKKHKKEQDLLILNLESKKAQLQEEVNELYIVKRKLYEINQYANMIFENVMISNKI